MEDGYQRKTAPISHMNEIKHSTGHTVLNHSPGKDSSVQLGIWNCLQKKLKYVSEAVSIDGIAYFAGCSPTLTTFLSPKLVFPKYKNQGQTQASHFYSPCRKYYWGSLFSR